MTFLSEVEVIPSTKFWPGRDAKWPVSGIVQHYTQALAEAKLVKWMASAEAQNSAHLFIYRNGHVVQMVGLSDRAFHAGDKRGLWSGKPQPTNVNHFTIGIENCNAGWLLKEGKTFYLPVMSGGKYVKGQTYRGPEPKSAKDHHGVERWWEPYTDELVAANIQVVRRLVEKYPAITRQGVQFHSDVSPHRKYDPGPLWPHEYVLDEVFGGGNHEVPASIVAMNSSATEPKVDEEETTLAANRSDNNQSGDNPEDHYDYVNGMSMIDRVDDDQCR